MPSFTARQNCQMRVNALKVASLGTLSIEALGRRRKCSVAVSAGTVVLLLKAWDELSDAEILDHLLENLVVLDLDLVDLDLGALGDEVHLSLSFLL